jgi:hypothetical protein
MLARLASLLDWLLAPPDMLRNSRSRALRELLAKWEEERPARVGSAVAEET